MEDNKMNYPVWDERFFEVSEDIATQKFSEDFRLRDDLQADKFVQEEATRQRDLKRLLALCDQEIEELKLKRESILADIEKDSFYKTQLMIYLENAPKEFKKETKTQVSYKLLSGTIVKKKGGLQAVRDNDALLSWAKETDADLVRIKEEADWAKIKKNVQLTEDGAVYLPTGEMIAGVTTEMKPDTYDIKFNEEV